MNPEHQKQEKLSSMQKVQFSIFSLDFMSLEKILSELLWKFDKWAFRELDLRSLKFGPYITYIISKPKGHRSVAILHK